MTVPKSTPTTDQTREQLMAHWREARRQREAAAPGSVAYRRALEEIARIEIEIARIERAMVPPRA
jgi:ribosomal protein L18E